MGYQLLWLEVLGFNLLLAALVTACSARLARRGWQLLWPGLIVGLNLLNAMGGLAGYYLITTQRVVFAWSGYFISLQLLSLAGAAVVLWRGLRLTRTDAPAPFARSWPRARLAVAAVVALGLSFMTFQDLDSAVLAEVAALRTEAGALALSVAPPAVPDAENAALVYQQAFEACPARESLPQRWQDRLDEWQKAPEAHLEETDFTDYLRLHEPALKLLRAAAARPTCHFDRNFAHPSISILLPEVSHMRQGAKLLRVNARVRMAHGDLAGAAAEIAAIRSMARHMRSDPILISFMVVLAIDNIANTTIEDWLAYGEIRSPEPLEAIRRIEGGSPRKDLVRAYRMEEAFGLATFADFSSGALDWRTLSSLAEESFALETPGMLNKEALGAWRVFFLRGELNSYRWHMNRMQSLAGSPYYESRERWIEYEEKHGSPTGIINGVILPATATISRNAARAEARTRLADLGVAMTRHRLKHGSYPDKLDDLDTSASPLLTVDPFDGQPLRMRTADGGLVLYSVGPDGKDDSGREFDSKTRLGDITFCLGAAYKARRK